MKDFSPRPSEWLPPGLTDTPVLAKFSLDPKRMSLKAMKVDQSVTEGLNALSANRPIIIPGRMNRIMRAILPATVTRSMMMKMLEKMPAIANPRPSSRGSNAAKEEAVDVSWVKTNAA